MARAVKHIWPTASVREWKDLLRAAVGGKDPLDSTPPPFFVVTYVLTGIGERCYTCNGVRSAVRTAGWDRVL
ncbi:MAG: hypothetical protein AB7V18_09265 [Pyrinomonadaceae bacterium]